MESASLDVRILQFRQEWRYRTDAHQREMEALGLAKLQELNAVDSSEARSAEAAASESATTHENAARDYAHDFVSDHRDALEAWEVQTRDEDDGVPHAAALGDLTLEQTVRTLSFYRSAGMADEVTTLEMWLLSEFPPQNIGGRVAVGTNRVRGGGRRRR